VWKRKQISQHEKVGGETMSRMRDKSWKEVRRINKMEVDRLRRYSRDLEDEDRETRDTQEEEQRAA
jgi:hypothetical protein